MNNRRYFIRKAAITSIGAIIIPSVIISKSKAEALNVKKPFPEMLHKADLRTLDSGSNYIIVKGKVYDKLGLVPQPGATIKVLNSSNNLFQSSRNSQITTNENGEYEFLLDILEKDKDKAPRMKFYISNEANAYSSELIVTNFDAHISDKHWELNQQLGKKLFPVKEVFASHSVLTFNLSI